MRQSLHRQDWMTFARQVKGARPRHLASPYPDLCSFKARSQHRTLSKFIDRDPHWYTRRVKEATHIRLHHNNINRASGIEIPEAWVTTIKKHNNRRASKKRTTEGKANRNNEDRNAPITAVENQPITTEYHAL